METKSKTFFVKFITESLKKQMIDSAELEIKLSNIEVNLSDQQQVKKSLQNFLRKNIDDSATLLEFWETTENNWLSENFKNQELRILTEKFFWSEYNDEGVKRKPFKEMITLAHANAKEFQNCLDKLIPTNYE